MTRAVYAPTELRAQMRCSPKSVARVRRHEVRARERDQDRRDRVEWAPEPRAGDRDHRGDAERARGLDRGVARRVLEVVTAYRGGDNEEPEVREVRHDRVIGDRERELKARGREVDQL